jgi:hypothetical protein
MIYLLLKKVRVIFLPMNLSCRYFNPVFTQSNGLPLYSRLLESYPKSIYIPDSRPSPVHSKRDMPVLTMTYV